MPQTPPLLQLFRRLQQRNLTLGLGEYLSLLRALERANITSREQLSWVCQARWAASPEEQQLVAAELDECLPRELTVDDLGELAEQAGQPLPDEAPSPREESAPEPAAAEEERAEPETDSPAPAVELSPVGSPLSGGQTVTRPTDISRSARRAYDLAGGLPAERRYMKRAWRYVRRMQRSGPPTELDIQSTIDRFHHQGVLAEPVLVPRLRNRMGVLLLVDQGGSMEPFRGWTRELIESARHSGFARCDVLFFHDVPLRYLFRDRSLLDPVPLTQLTQEFTDPGIVIIGDAGAARGRRDRRRARQTQAAIEALRGMTQRIGWLNPVPASRWAGTTADDIRLQCGLSMFPFDRAGLDAIMDVLRGRGS